MADWREGALECRECGQKKPYAEFPRNMGGGRKEVCSECFRDRVRGGNVVTREMFVFALDALGGERGAFTHRDLKHAIAEQFRLPEDALELSVRSHVRRFIKNGQLVAVGGTKPSGVGRPNTLYALPPRSSVRAEN